MCIATVDSYLISKDFYIIRKNAHCHCYSYLISKDFNIIRKNAHCRWLFLLDIQGVSGLLAQLGMAGVHQLGEHSGQGPQVIEHLRKIY